MYGDICNGNVHHAVLGYVPIVLAIVLADLFTI